MKLAESPKSGSAASTSHPSGGGRISGPCDEEEEDEGPNSEAEREKREKDEQVIPLCIAVGSRHVTMTVKSNFVNCECN